MKKYFLVLLGLLFPAIAGAAELPKYDSTAYCQKLADAGGGSYTVESGCMDMEKESQKTLAAMEIEDRILRYCDRLAKTGGGSYTVLQGCVDMEMESRKELGK